MEALVMTFGDFAEDALKEIETVYEDLTKQGLVRLEVAADGLPVTLDELSAFFASDLQDFGNGSVTMAGIRKACEWYAFTHMQRSAYWWYQEV